VIKVRPAGERGKTQTSWLDSNHTFSFNRYHDPRYMGFRDLRVINEDFLAPAQGFGTHSHENREILSYVVKGALEHSDSSGGSGVLRPNELQRMTAGTGVSHSEFNPSQTEQTHFLQIWILPEGDGSRPEYEQRSFSENGRHGRLRLLASREGRDGSVLVHQDVKVYDALLAAGDEIPYELSEGRHAWIQVIMGDVVVNGIPLQASDGAAVSEESLLSLQATKEAEILLFDLR
jgi:redox-sensitive bicupin YhaK (pirin superfamily)